MLFGGSGGGSASCSPVQPRRSRRRSRLPLHVGRLRTDVHVLERNVFNLVIELGSLVEETSSEFGVAGLLGEPQERGRLLEKIALARHSKHSLLRRKIRTKRGSYSPARHRAALLLQAPLADLERWQASSSSTKSRL